jgi:hypothetical protein
LFWCLCPAFSFSPTPQPGSWTTVVILMWLDFQRTDCSQQRLYQLSQQNFHTNWLVMWVSISKIKQGFSRNEYKATKPYFKAVYWTVKITNHLFPDSIYLHEDEFYNELRLKICTENYSTPNWQSARALQC